MHEAHLYLPAGRLYLDGIRAPYRPLCKITLRYLATCGQNILGRLCLYPMEFFVPHATDAEQAERAYAAIKEFVAGQVGSLTDKRIYRIRFSHDGNCFDLRVGDIHPQLGERVIAIFEGYIYYVCTQNRGVVRGVLPRRPSFRHIYRIVRYRRRFQHRDHCLSVVFLTKESNSSRNSVSEVYRLYWPATPRQTS